MKNLESWKPTKFITNNKGNWIPNPEYVGTGSRFICDLYILEYVRVIKKYIKGNLLDLGCGHIPFYEVYKDNISNNVCVDWAESIHQNPFLDHIVDLNQIFPFEDNLFDSVLCSDVLEHIAEPKQFINEVTRVLMPKGVLVLMVPFMYGVHEKPHDYHRYTEFALRKFCKENNLKIIELEPYGGYPDVIFDLLNKGLVRGEFMAKSYLGFTRIIRKTGFYKRIQNKTKEFFPLGYFLVCEKSK